MKNLVLGATGFIGGALHRALVMRGADVVPSLGRSMADLTFNGVWRDVMRASAYDTVYMCAGMTGGSGLNPLHFVTDNAIMALQCFRACADAGVKRIVYMSSTTGYPDSGRPMLEDEFFDGEPHPQYFSVGHTKRFIERLGAMYPQIETVFIRVSGVYGPGGDFDPQSSHVIEATIRKVAERQDPIMVWGTGENQRDALYIDDLVTALVQAARWPAGAYNVATGQTMSVNAILGLLCTIAKHEPRIMHDTTKPEMLAVRRLDCAKAHALGWQATVPMAAGLRRTFEWFEAQRG